MIKEIRARTLLSSSKCPDPWFGIKYTMNLYRGCQHHCIYCDSRSECYQVENFDGDVLVKVNAIELLEKELPRKRVKGTVGLGSMNDPYMPLEKSIGLTRRALEVIARCHFPVHIITKSDMVVRDIDLLEEIGQVYAAVSFTVTAADDGLSAKVEPGAPVSSRRFKAMRELADHGILAGVTLMPVLPFIEDNEENLVEIVERAAASGAKYITPALGMSLRNRQREYYYDALDRLFPGLREKYEARYGERYSCGVPDERRLNKVLAQACKRCGLRMGMPLYTPPQEAEQMSLFK